MEALRSPLAPNEALIQDLLVHLLSSHLSITQAATALQQVRLYPPDPAPDWLAPLQDKLGQAQTAATGWLVTTGPTVVTELPEALIDYNSRFQAIATNVRGADRETALRHFRWLKRSSADTPRAVSDLQASITAYVESVRAQKKIVADAITEAGKSLTTDNANVDALKARISDLMQKISGQTEDAKKGLTQAATSGASMSFAVLAYGFSVAMATGPAFPFLAIGGALASLTYGAVEHALKEREIVRELEQIRDLKVQLTADEQRVAALQGITSALQTVEDAVLGVSTSVGFAPIWQDVTSAVDDVIASLDQPDADPAKLAAITTLPAAAASWAAVSTMAVNIQQSAAGITGAWTVELEKLLDGALRAGNAAG